MIFLPGEKLRYAETHFKFKLPWSLLYKPWPEIIFDSPFQFVPGVEPTLWIVVRDADRFPTTLKTAEIVLKRTAERDGMYFENAQDLNSAKQQDLDNASQSDIVISKDLSLDVHEQMQFIPFPLGEIPAGTYEAYCKLTVERDGKMQTFERWNLPRLKQAPLRFKVLNEFPPIAPGYVAGEMHCHTHYSADHVEYGATPEVLQQAAKAVGLDFVSCTDHAYDFAFTQEDYTKEAESPVPRFQKLREEIAALPSKDESGKPMPLLLAGEEVSAGNSKGENVHVTVLAPDGYLPGLGDCGRYWLENRPTRSIKQILNDTDAHCFAAHPFQQMGLLEKFVFRRGYWKPEDLNIANKSTKKNHAIRGLQFWNGSRDEGFKLGREFWINELGKGNYLLPIGGNDAHGDLNDMTAVDLPLLSLKHTRAHIFGNVRTVIRVGSWKLEVGSDAKQESPLMRHPRPTGGDPHNDSVTPPQVPELAEGLGHLTHSLSLDVINAAFAADNCYITDGPALWWERDRNGITFHARSNRDTGGGFRYIRIYGRRMLSNGKLAPDEEVLIGSLVAAPDHADIPVATFDFAYVRAECETATGKFALTSAAQLLDQRFKKTL
ncbi:hypothetical protein [Fibrobacter sp.]|uniref:PHP domain-containing protein n=1 Tax=Fibrobacter sp. TaxID=35828 RepID=UPI0025C00910|nr:hypothetical protein [Fibrobacter sp.]